MDNNVFVESTSKTKLHVAIDEGDIERVKNLLKSGEIGVNITFEDGITPLFLAVKKKRVKMAEYLIGEGADVNRVCEGISPLYLAIDHHATDLAKYLIDRDADINFISNNSTLLHLAIERRHDEIAKYLVDKGADVNRVCEDTSPLHLAIDRGQTDIARYLIDKGANMNLIPNNLTLLHLAIKRGGDEIAKYLVDKGANVNAVCNDISPLYLAIVGGRTDIGKYLIDKGANVNTVFEDKSLLYLAIAQGQTDIAQYLINNGADVNGTFNKKRLLQVAIDNNDRAIVEDLLIAGFDVNTKDGYGNVAADYLNTFNRCNVTADIIKSHIVKLIAANFYVCEKNRVAVAGEKYDSLREACAREVNLMKQKLLMESTLTYYMYDLLREPLHKSALKLKFLFQNHPEPKFEYSGIYILYLIPCYKKIMQYRRNRVLERAKLLVQVDDFVLNISHDLLLDPEVVREIFQHLTNWDLKLLCNFS